jgi:hypothetical protein
MSSSRQLDCVLGVLGLLVAVPVMFILFDVRRNVAGWQIAAGFVALVALTAASLVSLVPVGRAVIDAARTSPVEAAFWILLLVGVLCALLLVWRATAAPGAVLPPARGPRRLAQRRWAKNWGKRWEKLNKNLSILVLTGVFVTAAPVYYTFNPPTPTPISRLGDMRLALMAAWLILLGLGVLAAIEHNRKQDKVYEEIVGEPLVGETIVDAEGGPTADAELGRRRALQRQQAAADILRLALDAARARFPAYQWALYVPLPGGERIGPVPGLTYADAKTWARGESVTGTAWATGNRTEGGEEELAAGGRYAVTDGPHNPDVREVVAYPVLNAEGRTIAVLTAVCYQRRRLLSTAEGKKYHEGRSILVGRVLVDILGYSDRARGR